MKNMILLILLWVTQSVFGGIPGLEGTCMAGCVKDGDPGMEYRKSTLVFHENTLQLHILNAKNNGCKEAPYTFLLNFNYEVKQNSHSHLYRNIDLKLEGYYLVLHQSKYAAYYNKIKYCKRDDWKTNVPQPISNEACGVKDLYPLGTKLYQIYRTWENQLRLGEMNGITNALSPESRPTHLDILYQFLKQ